MCFCWTSGRKGKPRRDTIVLTGRMLMGAECRLAARCGAYWPCVSVTPDDVTLQIRQTLNPLSLEVRIHHQGAVLRGLLGPVLCQATVSRLPVST